MKEATQIDRCQVFGIVHSYDFAQTVGCLTVTRGPWAYTQLSFDDTQNEIHQVSS